MREKLHCICFGKICYIRRTLGVQSVMKKRKEETPTDEDEPDILEILGIKRKGNTQTDQPRNREDETTERKLPGNYYRDEL